MKRTVTRSFSKAACAYSGLVRDSGGVAKETDMDIMAKMSSSLSKIRWVLAAWLPLCLVWVFLACVSLCAAQTDECEKPLTIRPDSSQEANHCPLTQAIDGVMPERQASSTRVTAQTNLLAETVAIDSCAPLSESVLRFTSSPDPPLKLLCVLRI